mmetsp:Transcript_18432/g.25827  ORF Transcript_18432/g.25827 Transcript_18432/m.25827 type:complete len:85 (-) Transcript_18432:246-500(-)
MFHDVMLERNMLCFCSKTSLDELENIWWNNYSCDDSLHWVNSQSQCLSKNQLRFHLLLIQLLILSHYAYAQLCVPLLLQKSIAT